MSRYRLKVRVALMSSLSLIALVSGCQSQPKQHAPKAPVSIVKGTLAAAGRFYAYAYVNGTWKTLLGNGPYSAPSDPFQKISFSPGGTLTATTVGSNDDSLIGNQVELWTYDKGWNEVKVNGDETVAHYAWSPSNQIYAAPDDGKTMGVWFKSNGHWKVVSGSAAFSFISSIEFSPTGVLTITAQASDGSSTVYQYQNGKWHRLNTGNVAFAPDGIQVNWSPQGVLMLATSQHGIWQYVNGSWSQPGGVASPIGNVAQIGWSPQGNLVVAGDASKSQGIWTLANGHWSPIGGTSAQVAKDGISQFGWSPTGVLTVSDATTGHIDQLKSGHWSAVWTRTSPGNSKPVTFAWSPSGNLTCVGGSIGGLWQYRNGKWAQIGGDKSPLKGQSPISFGWSAK